MLEQALHGLAEGAEQNTSAAEKPSVPEDEANSVIAVLERFMGAFLRDRGQP